MSKKNKILILTASLTLVAKFWIGIYAHDEFGGNHLFIKHKPIWKSFFYSPIGMSDLTLSELSEEKKTEQLLFNEFVAAQGKSK